MSCGSNIVIVSEANDPSAERVVDLLRHMGIPIRTLVQREFPEFVSLTVCVDNAGGARVGFESTESWEFGPRDTIWLREIRNPVVHSRITDPRKRRMVENECYELLRGAYELSMSRWFPGRWGDVLAAERKLPQLRAAVSVGFEVPDTLVSTNPVEVIAFFRKHEGRIITKTLGQGMRWNIPEASRYTRLMSLREVKYIPDASLCPVIYQPYMEKRLEIRATVVGEQVFAVAIHSQVTGRTEHDWRRYDLQRTPHEVYELPADVAARCVALTKNLSLNYGAIDLILTPDGRYVFLEVNPGGQWLWLEDLTGIPISRAIANWLAFGHR